MILEDENLADGEAAATKAEEESCPRADPQASHSGRLECFWSIAALTR